MTKIYKLQYDDIDRFTAQELNLITRNAMIFNHPDAPLCPECNREKSPKIGGTTGGMCLLCIEDKLKNKKAALLEHLPERWPAGADLVMMAKELIIARHPVAKDAAIAYLLKKKHGEQNGKIVLGSCAKQSPKNKMLHGWDFIIEIAWDMWALCDDRQREALLLHELCHIDKEDERWKIQPHSVEEHIEVVEAYGLWKPDLQAFAQVVNEAEAQAESRQMPIFSDAVRDAAKNFVGTLSEGDSVEYHGPGLAPRKLVKLGGKMVEECRHIFGG